MGFIEDERRRHAAILNALQQRDKDLESERVSREKTRAAEKAHEEELLQQSKQYFEQSGLRGMLEELGRLGSHNAAFGLEKWGNSSSIDIEVNSVDLRVWIKTTPNGTIKIEGGRHGSTTLPRDKWQGKDGPEALEKALEKAYKHPKGKVIDRSTPNESYPGN